MLVSLLCLQISCVRGVVMWCKLWETSYMVLFIYLHLSFCRTDIQHFTCVSYVSQNVGQFTNRVCMDVLQTAW